MISRFSGPSAVVVTTLTALCALIPAQAADGVAAAAARSPSTKDGFPTASVAPDDVPMLPKLTTQFPPGSQNYQMKRVAPYTVINDTWAVDSWSRSYPNGEKWVAVHGDRDTSWWTRIGATPLQRDGSLTTRVQWKFPYIPNCPAGKGCDYIEVMSYPSIVYGRSASSEPLEGAKVPIQLSKLKTLTTHTASVVGSTDMASGQYHVSYDLWITKSPDSMAGPARHAEIMMPIWSVNGYGIPRTEGRNCAPSGPTGGCLGRGQHFLERKMLGGASYDIYFDDPHTDPGRGRKGSLGWRFIVLVPVDMPQGRPHTVDWSDIFRYLQTPHPDLGGPLVEKGLFLTDVSIGIEMISTKYMPGQPNGEYGSAGDVTVGGVRFDVTP